MTHSDSNRTIELIFEPQIYVTQEMVHVRVTPSELLAVLGDPVPTTLSLPEGTVIAGSVAPDSLMSEKVDWANEVKPPRVALPGSVPIQHPMVLDSPTMFVEDSAVCWGGNYTDPDAGFCGPTFSPSIHVSKLHHALEPYPIDEPRAELWRKILTSDTQRAAVLLRPGSRDPLALEPRDLERLFSSGDSTLWNVATSVLGRTRGALPSKGGRSR